MEVQGGSHRITQRRHGGVAETAPTMAQGRKVTNKRVQQPRNLMFDKEHGHDPAAPTHYDFRDISSYDGTR